MAVFREVLKTTLTSDAALMLILTGGVQDASTQPQDGGGASSLPTESNGVTVKPFASIRFGSSRMAGVQKINAQAGSVELYFYQDTGYDKIEQAITRALALLNDQYLSADDRALAHLSQPFISGDTMAEELGNLPCRFLRFAVTDIRK